MNSDVPSRSAVRKAGSTLRKHFNGQATDDEGAHALTILRAYRQQFQAPMVKVSSELGRQVRSARISAEITQRLKRESTIYEKITHRESQLDLSRMRDIAGCRVVLFDNNQHDLYRLVDGIERTWEKSRVIDYIQHPRESGYRAIHVIVIQDDHPVEIQLRTHMMHLWASDVEALGDLLGQNFKYDGNSLTHQFMRLRADIENMPAGQTDERQLSEYSALGAEVLSILRKHRTSNGGALGE